jgi:2-dehydro-3-deoxyphosphogluconate aldolase/(4S)-4-hydroxy-2-oxoglutarate aldolase
MFACEAIGLPLLVGAATASEPMKLLEKSYSIQNFFPAEASGGVKRLHLLRHLCPKSNSVQRVVSYLKKLMII